LLKSKCALSPPQLSIASETLTKPIAKFSPNPSSLWPQIHWLAQLWAVDASDVFQVRAVALNSARQKFVEFKQSCWNWELDVKEGSLFKDVGWLGGGAGGGGGPDGGGGGFVTVTTVGTIVVVIVGPEFGKVVVKLITVDCADVKGSTRQRQMKEIVYKFGP
jgi:hypothetical protein